ncbi:MAG TPA: hypothetical protein VFZ61_07570 [Polyangiales bacterium]
MQVERQISEQDRRRIRSSDPQQALSLQLSHVRDEAQLDALVLASPEGLPIAHAGDLDLCSELAALAPLLSTGQAANADIQQGLLFVRAVNVDGEPLYLASCGDDLQALSPAAVDRWLLEATAGVRRILAA